MISELFRKWFGLDPIHCETCEILRAQLDESSRERKDLLHRLLEKDKSEPSSPQADVEEFKPITSNYVPWRVRQQMLEAEDRKTAHLLKEKQMEIDEAKKKTDPKIEQLEKELGVK